MIITPKLRNQKPKKKNTTLKRLFGLVAKDVFCFPCFFWVLKCKKRTYFFLCLVIFSNHKPSKKQKKHNVFSAFAFQSQKKQNENQKKTFFEAKPKSLFKVLVFWFLVLCLLCVFLVFGDFLQP
jgi:hypothetical protein